MTTKVDPFNSLHLGQETFFISNLTSEKNFLILFIYASNQSNSQIQFFLFLQEWQGSNPQPPVLETGALPIELHSFSNLPDGQIDYWVI